MVPAMEHKQAHLLVHGHVQGVWFRESTRQEATRLGVTGWVRNLPEGAVEIVAVGEDDRLARLITWAHRGPQAARVDRVELVWQSPPGMFATFEVRR